MKSDIIRNLDNPVQLEKLYRQNKKAFHNAFDELYPELQEHAVARTWHERLHYGEEGISWGSKSDWLLIILLCFLAGLVAKIPDMAGLEYDSFYQRNISFVVFPFLTAFFAWRQKIDWRKLMPVGIVFIVSVFYINLLPVNPSSDTLLLACIHLPLFLWSVVGYTFTGCNFQDISSRLDFLRYNGDLAVMGAVMMIAGIVFSAVTVGLFQLIDLQIEEIYARYVGVWGGASLPIVATYLVRTNPHLVSKVSPVIARVFTPLVLALLVIYLVAVVYTGKDPYNDREFLLVFNLLLVGVMAIILFSVAEASKESGGQLSAILMLVLSVLTIVVNGIALSAILFRISAWGITPNRLAVLGGNVLILVNLFIVSYRLFRSVLYKDEMQKIETSIGRYLPVYVIWSLVVICLFPLLFGFM